MGCGNISLGQLDASTSLFDECGPVTDLTNNRIVDVKNNKVVKIGMLDCLTIKNRVYTEERIARQQKKAAYWSLSTVEKCLKHR